MINYLAQNIPSPKPYNYGIHLPMINDVSRNSFYDSLIKENVKGKVCAEAGFGSGLLTALMVYHGAKHVYAFEPDKTTFEFGKKVLEKLGYSDKITFINDKYHYVSGVDVVIHELLNKNIWGEGLYNIYRQTFDKAKIYPNSITLEVLYTQEKPEELCADDSFILNTGLKHLKNFEKTFQSSLKNDDFKSYNNWFINNEDYIFDRHNRNNNKRVVTKFKNKLLNKKLNLNNDKIGSTIKEQVFVPDNSYVTIRVKLQDELYLDLGHWNESKVIYIKNKGTYTFIQDCSNGNWWFE